MFEVAIESIIEDREEAREEGREEGRAEGWGKGREDVARKALVEGVSVDLISKITGLDIEIIKTLV